MNITPREKLKGIKILSKEKLYIVFLNYATDRRTFRCRNASDEGESMKKQERNKRKVKRKRRGGRERERNKCT